MYSIIYYNGECTSWEFETKFFDTAKEAHKFALENYFNDGFHVVKICLVNEPTDYDIPIIITKK